MGSSGGTPACEALLGSLAALERPHSTPLPVSFLHGGAAYSGGLPGRMHRIDSVGQVHSSTAILHCCAMQVCIGRAEHQFIIQQGDWQHL